MLPYYYYRDKYVEKQFITTNLEAGAPNVSMKWSGTVVTTKPVRHRPVSPEMKSPGRSSLSGLSCGGGQLLGRSRQWAGGGDCEGSSGEQEQGEKSGTQQERQERLCLGDNLRNRGVVKWQPGTK